MPTQSKNNKKEINQSRRLQVLDTGGTLSLFEHTMTVKMNKL